MSINLSKFIDDLKTCIDWPYSSPGGTGQDCSSSGIDCSGMLVRAYKLQGGTIAHGSNTIWRNGSLQTKGSLTSQSQLQVGYAVFIRKNWSNSQNDKKNKYYNDDIGNMSHIGIVVSVNPLTIIDASYSKGKVRLTTSIKAVGWTHWGRLSAVDYSGNLTSATQSATETSVTTIATKKVGTVISQGKLNLRKKPSLKGARIMYIDPGQKVNFIKNAASSGWMYVSYNGKSGYVMSKYINLTTEEVSNA